MELGARQVGGVRRAALLQCGAHVVLAVETDSREALALVQRHLVTNNFEGLLVERVAQLPMDRRHNSKVDYTALRLLLGKQMQ